MKYILNGLMLAPSFLFLVQSLQDPRFPPRSQPPSKESAKPTPACQPPFRWHSPRSGEFIVWLECPEHDFSRLALKPFVPLTPWLPVSVCPPAPLSDGIRFGGEVPK